MLIASGMPHAEIAEQLGHSIGVLLSTYTHVIAEFKGQDRIDPESQIQAARRLREAV